MSFGQLVRTTKPGELNALAFQDIKIWSCASQIHDMLRQHFGESISLCFANPVANRADNSVDWYCPLPGTPVPLPELPEESRRKLTGHLRLVAQDVDKLAEELISSGEPLKITRGNILRRALIYPGEEYIYAIGELPVITAWGFTPPGSEAAGANLGRLAAQRSVASKQKIGPDGLQDNVPKRFAWLWWLLPLLALLLLLYLLFTSFGPVEPISGRELFHASGEPFMEALAETAQKPEDLKKEIAALEARLGEHVAQCRPQLEKPVREASKPDALAIPPDARNLGFLSGRWLCETGLGNTRTGEPVKVLFNFDGTGHGEAKIIEANDQCDGPATARLENGILRIEMEELKCKRQNLSYGKTAINCENSVNSETLCAGRNYDGSTWGATFLKLR